MNGQIKKGYLFYVDGDLDGYTDGSTLVYDANSAKAGHRRASDGGILGSSDCQDTGGGSSLVYRNVGSLGLDVDHDRYTTGTSTTRCVGATSSYWYRDTTGVYKYITTTDDLGTNTDCLDSSSAVNPGITAWYTTSGPNGWDYNCASGEEQRWTDASSACGGTIWQTESGCNGDADQGMGACNCVGTNEGWVGSAAACGATASYVATNSCPDFGPGCPGSRTQECH